jgi:hypothetical protein
MHLQLNIHTWKKKVHLVTIGDAFEHEVTSSSGDKRQKQLVRSVQPFKSFEQLQMEPFKRGPRRGKQETVKRKMVCTLNVDRLGTS